MKALMVTGPGKVEVLEVPDPVAGPADVLVKMKACGVCGADPHAVREGGIVPGQSQTPLGHEPAGEVVFVGPDVADVKVGDHVVVDPMGVPDAIMGGGGAQGALSDFIVVRNAVAGGNLKVIPGHVPWHVAALNEPMAVALRGVNRTRPKPGDKVVVFGAGPIGLGALLGYKRAGVGHVVVVDLQANRLEKALRIGADAVVNSAEEDLVARLIELHGEARDGFGRGGRPGTDIYLDAAGASAVIETVLRVAKLGACLGVVGVQKKPIEVDFQDILATELTIAMAMGHPDEIFEVTDDIVDNWEKYAVIVSDQVPFTEVERALELAGDPGATDKVVVVFN
ncbi:zinc-binding dehydrogenase [Nonomuraea sp. NPDC026600]|uniref:zinc-dependent alcohol dehydrogenase n=1 Tax=Nonomuraea sp. NPDC026600 TaxID=3155363 RepID=UPI0033F66865